MKAADIYALVAVQLAASLVLTYLKFRNLTTHLKTLTDFQIQAMFRTWYKATTNHRTRFTANLPLLTVRSGRAQSSNIKARRRSVPAIWELTEMYEIDEKKPEKKHANSSGEVLWYGPANGFWVGHWSLPTYCYTHWMMLPDPPQRTETPAEQAEREFEAYFEATFSKRADDKQSEGDAALREKMREAFMRGLR